jgi:hypothetical protein
MNEPGVKTHTDFVLPPNVVSKSDISRLVSEFEQADNDLTTASVRSKVGSDEPTQLALSPQLTDFFNQNALKPGSSQERSEIIKQLRLLKENVPVIHMTFAVTADRESLGQLVQWLRASVHPQAVISVGLQPALVAGVYVRTPNHVHDFSLRTVLKSQHGALVKELETLRGSR